jgi:ribonuclease-3
MEAVVAALYLGGGLEPVLALLDRFLGEAFARAAAGTLDRDYKTQLQELAQSRLRVSPRYRVVAEHGPDHSKLFEVELELKGEIIGRGAGRSKKDAEQAAAKLALEAMNGRLGEAKPPLGAAPEVPVMPPTPPPPLAVPEAEPAPAREATAPVAEVEAAPVPAEPPPEPARRRAPKRKRTGEATAAPKARKKVSRATAAPRRNARRPAKA